MEASRSFGGINNDVYETAKETSMASEEKRGENLLRLRSSILGSDSLFSSPYGQPKPIVYADWTASARGVHQIEDYIQREVMPFYGNTHTTTSVTGHQSTCYRHESRQIIAEAVNAKVTGRAATDVVLFTGNGTTSSIDKLIQGMGLNLPIPEGYDKEKYCPVVFTSAYEHHSNLLPWRETQADVVTVAYSPETGVDLADLAEKLEMYRDRAVKIGAFCAASNVTGVLTAVDEVSILLHECSALAFFDYATAAPYVKMDMNPVRYSNDISVQKLSKTSYQALSKSKWDPKYAYKDAIYFSGHKFLGGVGSPGVLVVKRSVLPVVDTLPSTPGGGTVFFVTPSHHRYLSNREEREEGGTPNILGDIKVGLSVNLKRSFGDAWIEEEELRINDQIIDRLRKHPKVVLLGKHTNTLPIFSFLVREGGKFLHFNFVCALLNDLFGVQMRGGCQCAGPFAHSLLGLVPKVSVEIEDALLEKHEVLRPGFTRFSMPFWVGAEERDFVLSCVEFVASHGHEFLPSYRYNHKTGEWAHATRLTKFPERKWLGKFDMFSSVEGNLGSPSGETEASSSAGSAAKISMAQADLPAYFAVALSAAEEELSALRGASRNGTTAATTESLGRWEHLRWFLLGSEVSKLREKGFGTSPTIYPIDGPIKPSDDIALAVKAYEGQDLAASSSVADHSAYRDKQDKKLSAKTGGGWAIPQYLKNVSIVGSSSSSRQDKDVPATSSLSSSSDEGKTMDTPSVPVSPASREGPEPVSVVSTGTETELDPDCPDGKCLLPVKRNLPSAAETFSVEPVQPPKKMMRSVGQCMQDWSMIQDGDRLLLGLSGGKDSLSLLHVLLALQKKAPVKFELACCTIDPQTASFDPSPLIPYVRGLGVPYFYISKPIVEMASSKMQGDSLCAFCSRFKRGLLYTCCRENNYNKLVLAQHLDDLGESFIMSALHNGQLRTMKAKYTIDAGDIEVIRPFCYLRESVARDFAKESSLPVISENCPACFEEPKERARVKQLLSQEESMVPALFSNMRKALLPLMHDDTYQVMERVAQDIEAKAGKKRTPTRDKSDGRATKKKKEEEEGGGGEKHAAAVAV